jgi:uroporphyrinogen III methyltransferase/synthase
MSAPRTARGRVILVGAGPGDPDLITVRGLKALQAADVVVYDALASGALLDQVPAGIARINVGKRGHDLPTRPQAETTELLLTLAREGKTVVRLKGGDPYIFGRGGEEASACADAGIDFEVIPGISSSSSAPAYAGIPLTDRRHAASFAVVTGHKDPSKVAEETRWEALATAVDTLVILMGMRKLSEIVERLLAGGRDPKTPAAVIMNGTLPTQRVVVAPLCEIAHRSREAGLGAPAAVVIGDVVRLREKLAWFEALPLFGKRVLVTRDEGPGGRLASALRAAGAEPIVAPMIRLAPPAEWAAVDAALDVVAEYAALLVTSANAVRYLVGRAEERGLSLAGADWQVFAVGPQTAKAAREAGLPVHAIPAERFDAEGLLAVVAERLPPRGRRFLFPCAEGARDALPEGLVAAGGVVDRVTTYRTLPAEIGRAALRELLLGPGLDALTFTSPSGVENFAALLDDESRSAAGRCIVAAIGPVTAEALQREGMAPSVVAERAGMSDLVAALAKVMSGGVGGNP